MKIFHTYVKWLGKYEIRQGSSGLVENAKKLQRVHGKTTKDIFLRMLS